MKYAIETLEIELNRQKSAMRNADHAMSLDPQTYWADIYNAAQKRVEEIGEAIEILRNSKPLLTIN